MASLASVLLGRSKDELIGDDIAMRRRLRQSLWAAGSVLVSLSILLALSTRFALSQRDALARSLVVVRGQKLATEAQLVRAQSANQLQLSALLSIEALRLAPSAEATAQLRQTVALLLPLFKQFDLPGTGGPTEAVTDIAFSADSRSIAAVGLGATPRWLDIATGKALKTFTADAPKGLEMAVALTPDGSQVITSSLAGVDFWSALDGKLLRHTESLSDPVRTMALSADGRYLATGHYGGAVRVIDRLSGREVVAGKHDIIVNALAYNRDSTLLISASNDSSARVWSLSSGRELQRLPHESGVLGVAFSADGKRAATAGWEGMVRVWDLASRRQIAGFDHRSTVNALAFSPDDSRLATAGTDATVRIWDQVTGLEVARATHEAAVVAVKFSPDGRTLATASKRTVALWKTAYGNEVAQLRDPDDIVSSVGFSPDGQHLITAASDTARVWNLSDGRELYRLKHDAQVEDVAYTADGTTIKTVTKAKPTADGSTCAHRWDVVSRTIQNSLCPGLSSIAFGTDGGFVVVAGPRGKVSVLELAGQSNETVIRDVLGADFQSEVALSAHHRYVGVATDVDEAARLQIANTASDSKPRVVALDSRANQLTFAADERTIAAATQNGVALWNAADGRPLGRVSISGGAFSIAISPDGGYLATGGRDQSVRVWQLPAFAEVARFEMGGNATRVAFSPDNELIAAASSDRTARVWRWRTDPSRDACSRLSRNLTHEEWRRYLGDLPYRSTCPDLANAAQPVPPASTR